MKDNLNKTLGAVVSSFIDKNASITFRTNFVVRHALDKAANEKRISVSEVIEHCFLDGYDLRRIIRDFSDEDWEVVRKMSEGVKEKRGKA